MDRLPEAVARLSLYAGSPSEVLDLFYLAERFGVWNQKLARESRSRISPFYSRKAMSALGDGSNCSLHTRLIKKYLPLTLHIPINGEETPSQYNRNIMNDLRLELNLLKGKISRRLLKTSGLQNSRAAVMEAVINSVPQGFLHSRAENWADYGAQRFLQLYKEKTTAIF